MSKAVSAALVPSRMQPIDSFAPPGLDLLAAVRRQQWDWFTVAARRVNIAAEIVDERGTPALPLAGGATAAALRRLLTAPASPVHRSGLSAALRTGQSQSLSVERLQLLCLPLTIGRGAVVLARGGTRAQDAVEGPEDLESIGGWLVRAVEAHLTSAAPSQDHEVFERISALYRLLGDAAKHGIERNVVSAFAEAVAVWDDLEIRGFVEDVRGRLVPKVALAGAELPETPVVLEERIAGRDQPLIRLSFADAERLGFDSKDVFVTRLGGESSQPWVIALSGAIGPGDESRLTLYVELLRDTVVRIAASDSSRTSWTIAQHLLAAGEQVEGAITAALAALSHDTEATGAALVVNTAAGVPLLKVGDPEAMSVPRGPDRSVRLVSSAVAGDGRTVLVALRRADGEPFTRREQGLADRAAAVFAAWAPGPVLRARGAERRAAARAFQDVLDRTVRRTLQDGLDVAVMVILAAQAVFHPGLLQQWVLEIRGQLRASDMAGVLSDREIGVLLTGAPPDVAANVATRLRQSLGAQGDAIAAAAVVGLASHSGGLSPEGSLVHAAREDAAHLAAAGRQRGDEATR